MDYMDLITNIAKRNRQRVLTNGRKPHEIEGVDPTDTTTKRKKKNNPETAATDEISKYLIDAGYIVVKVNSSNLWSETTKMPLRSYIIRNYGASSGFPDLMAFKNNQYLLIEVKSEAGRQSPSQQRFEDLCNAHGVTYILARGIGDVQPYIDYTGGV